MSLDVLPKLPYLWRMHSFMKNILTSNWCPPLSKFVPAIQTPQYYCIEFYGNWSAMNLGEVKMSTSKRSHKTQSTSAKKSKLSVPEPIKSTTSQSRFIRNIQHIRYSASDRYKCNFTVNFNDDLVRAKLMLLKFEKFISHSIIQCAKW